VVPPLELLLELVSESESELDSVLVLALELVSVSDLALALDLVPVLAPELLPHHHHKPQAMAL